MKKTILLSVLVFVLAFGLSLAIQQVLAAIIIGSDLDMQNNKIMNLGTPTENPDAATKEYVDTRVGTAQFWTASGTHIYNTNTGNVGIGTTSPAQKLHLYSAQTIAMRIEGGEPRFEWRDIGAGVGNRNWSLSVIGGVQGDFTGVAWDENWFQGDVWLQVRRVSGTSAIQYVQFPTGNVGIGTTTPQAKLDVAGDIKTSGKYKGQLGRGTTYQVRIDPWHSDVEYKCNDGDYMVGIRASNDGYWPPDAMWVICAPMQ